MKQTFEENWQIAKTTGDSSKYDGAVRDMLDTASNQTQYNAAIDLSINGRVPRVIDTLDKITGQNKED
jgi:hypothetical protein